MKDVCSKYLKTKSKRKDDDYEDEESSFNEFNKKFKYSNTKETIILAAYIIRREIRDGNVKIQGVQTTNLIEDEENESITDNNQINIINTPKKVKTKVNCKNTTVKEVSSCIKKKKDGKIRSRNGSRMELMSEDKEIPFNLLGNTMENQVKESDEIDNGKNDHLALLEGNEQKMTLEKLIEEKKRRNSY